MPFRRFLKDERGAAVERLATLTGLIAIAGVMGAHELDDWSKQPTDSMIAAAREADPARWAARISGLAPSDGKTTHIASRNLDYTPVGTIPGLRQSVVLDPCTGTQK